jgi:hypothetical protein
MFFFSLMAQLDDGDACRARGPKAFVDTNTTGIILLFCHHIINYHYD